MFGAEGVHWERDADGYMEMIARNQFGDYFQSGLLMNQGKTRASAQSQPELTLSDIDAGTRYYEVDQEAVQRVFSCRGFGSKTGGMMYIRAGQLDAELIDQARRDMHAAGLDDVVKSYIE